MQCGVYISAPLCAVELVIGVVTVSTVISSVTNESKRAYRELCVCIDQSWVSWGL